MTTNQKIAIGCGGGGCLLLIVVAIIGAGGYLYYRGNATNYNGNRNTDYNFNSSSNRNSNASDSAPSTSSSISDDNRHKLYQAAAASYERDLIKRTNEKLGLLDADGVPRQKYAQFTRDHIAWIFRNTDWINQECSTREKAKAYAEAHIND